MNMPLCVAEHLNLINFYFFLLDPKTTCTQPFTSKSDVRMFSFLSTAGSCMTMSECSYSWGAVKVFFLSLLIVYTWFWGLG